jgi:hypothetical protein
MSFCEAADDDVAQGEPPQCSHTEPKNPRANYSSIRKSISTVGGFKRGNTEATYGINFPSSSSIHVLNLPPIIFL